MQVSFADGKLFYKLYAALLSFVNGRLKVVPEQFSSSQEYTGAIARDQTGRSKRPLRTPRTDRRFRSREPDQSIGRRVGSRC